MSSITTKYLNALNPPAPFASVTVSVPDGSASVPDCAAQIDSAADWTVLPQRIVEQLGLEPVRAIELLGFAGTVTTLPVYLVKLALTSFQSVEVEVTAQADEPWILLGRSVLNRYKVTLDGPSQRLTIDGP
jgi:predicted aspartyl protease